MAKRKVFGRRKVALDSGRYTFEMREDGVYMRRLHGRELVTVPFDHLVKLFARQLMLNYERMDESNEIKPVSGLWQGPLVPGQSYGPMGPVHEGDQRPDETTTGWTGGLATLPKDLPVSDSDTPSETTTPVDNQLPTTN